jgi:hypothetical protein
MIFPYRNGYPSFGPCIDKSYTFWQSSNFIRDLAIKIYQKISHFNNSETD